jgi:hypothetical protein
MRRPWLVAAGSITGGNGHVSDEDCAGLDQGRWLREAGFPRRIPKYLQQTLSDWISEAEESVGDCSAALGILKACESDCDWEEVAKELLENRYWGDDAIEQLIQLASNLDAWVTERLRFEEYQEACEDYARHSGTCSCYCYGFRTWLDHGKRMIPFVIENGSARMLEWGVKS